MRITKANKVIRAANETGDSDIPTYKQAQEILDCKDSDWEEFGFSCEEECQWFKKKAKKLLDERGKVNACKTGSRVMRISNSTKTDVDASSSTDKALQHIKAAIDILGKSGNKDDITKDSIANLSVVMFDLKGKE